MKNKILLFLSVVLCLLFVLSFKKTGKTDEYIIKVPRTISSIPLLELNGKKIAGKKIKVEYFQDHIIAMAEFMQGKTDILMTGFTQGLANYYGNKDVVLAACSVWGVSRLITGDRSIQSLEDMTGKTILVPFAKSPLDLQLRAILKSSGLEDKITIGYAVPQQAVPMLITGKADAICVPEPLASKLIISGKAHNVFNFADKWAEVSGGEKRSPQVSIFVKKDFSESNKKQLEKIIAAVDSQIALIKKDPSMVSEKYKADFNLPAAVLSSGLANTLMEIPGYNDSKKLCLDYLEILNYNNDQSGRKIEDSFFFRYRK